MSLVDELTAAGVKPARLRRLADFLAQHPDLKDEIRQARAAGFTWPQIASQITADYGETWSATTLADVMEGRR